MPEDPFELPARYKHRDNDDDHFDYMMAIENDEVGQLFRRWDAEDEKTREVQRKEAHENRKQDHRDQQMAEMAQTIEKLKSDKRVAELDPETKDTLTSIKEFIDKAKDAPADLPMYMTKSQLADFLNLAEKTIDKLVKQAILPEPKTLSDKTGSTNPGRKIQRWKTEEVINQVDHY